MVWYCEGDVTSSFVEVVEFLAHSIGQSVERFRPVDFRHPRNQRRISNHAWPNMQWLDSGFPATVRKQLPHFHQKDVETTLGPSMLLSVTVQRSNPCYKAAASRVGSRDHEQLSVRDVG